MSKYVKGLLQEEYAKKFESVEDFLVVSTMGIDGNENNRMRGELGEKGIKLSVVQNSLMRRALTGIGSAAAASLFLAGPCAVAYGGESIVDVAKEFADWSKKVKGLSFRGAFVDGEAFDSEGAKALAKMPTRSELQGAVVMLAQSPGRRVAGAVAAPGGIIAGCIKGLVEKLEEAA